MPITISCFYYPTYMVKAISGDKNPSMEHAGAIVPDSRSSCREKNQDENYTGWGPFVGVKGGFVFFGGSGVREDGDEGFVLTNSSGRMSLLDFKIGDFESIRVVPRGIVLRYRRAFFHSCSLYYGRSTACWSEIRALTALPDASAPLCRDAYEHRREIYQKNHWRLFEDVTKFPAAVSYNVEARYVNGKWSFTPRPGSVECWPEF